MPRGWPMLQRYFRLIPGARASSWRVRTLSTSHRLFQEEQRRKRGRPRKNEQIAEQGIAALVTDEPSRPVQDETSVHEIELIATTKKRVQRASKSSPAYIPPRILSPTTKHHDLSSFLRYASTARLDPSTNVYKGTHYEYTVAAALQRYNFTLTRKGRSHDLGIDLLGHWTLPEHSPTPSNKLQVIVQCKASKPRPSMIRELEGTYVGAPAGWRGEGVLALLVSNQEGTKAVNTALTRSSLPMGIMQVTTEGRLKQFLWNPAAAKFGLDRMGVSVRYSDNDRARGQDVAEEDRASLILTWMGKAWSGTDAIMR